MVVAELNRHANEMSGICKSSPDTSLLVLVGEKTEKGHAVSSVFCGNGEEELTLLHANVQKITAAALELLPVETALRMVLSAVQNGINDAVESSKKQGTNNNVTGVEIKFEEMGK